MTLLELMAVVAIIGIFVALAAPGMAGVMSDRHAQRAADDVGGLFRVARMRAVATGAAHMVRVTTSGATSRFELRAAMGMLGGPISSCMTPSWTDADSRQLSVIDFAAAGGSYGGRDIRVTAVSDGLGTTPPAQDYCFTPGGTPWWRTGGAWLRPNGTQVSRYQVARFDTSGAMVGVRRVLRFSASGLPSIEAD